MAKSDEFPRRRGEKRSSWRTFHRRLFLARRLVRGSADATTLIADTRAFFDIATGADDDGAIYPPDARAALRHDLAALRAEFDCAIDLVADGRYALTSLGRLALLDLPDADLEALAFLLSTFRESPLPNADRVDAVLDRIVTLLPADRQMRLGRHTRDVRFDLPQPTAPGVDQLLAKLRRSLGQQQVRFSYRSTYAEGAAVITHRVSPYELIFREGHIYLEAYVHDCGIPEFCGRYMFYRLDRMVSGSLNVLSDVVLPIRPSRPHYHLRYTLSPPVARQRDIALWFPGSEVIFREDGSALVSAETSDLWQARQILLRYREHCRVIEPLELITLICQSITAMSEVYQ